MNKLTRKLFISILTLALTFISLGASTFAWFTLSNKAEVQKFNANVTAGAGIEISLNNITYTNSISATDVVDAVIANGSSRTTMDDVSTADGVNFTTLGFDDLGNQELQTVPTGSGYFYFDLYFRSPEAGISVFLIDNTTIGSTGVPWIPDAAFDFAVGTPVTAGGATKTVYAANALRFSTEEYEITVSGTGTTQTTAINESAPKTAKVFELTPTTAGNTRLDTAVVNTHGMVPYYNAKYPTAPLNESLADLPTNPAEGEGEKIFFDSSNLASGSELASGTITGKTPVVTLSASASNPVQYFYGVMRIRFWLEGWDPDMYNSIMGDILNIYLNFGGAKTA